jgi:ASC-1-like (ASCH) protein
MDHVAIMRKKWELIPKILDGRKTIESRWSRFKIAPWGRVRMGDRVFFKNSGKKVISKASVLKVLQFEDLTSLRINKILRDYGGEGKICISNTKKNTGVVKG